MLRGALLANVNIVPIKWMGREQPHESASTKNDVCYSVNVLILFFDHLDRRVKFASELGVVFDLQRDARGECVLQHCQVKLLENRDPRIACLGCAADNMHV